MYSLYSDQPPENELVAMFVVTFLAVAVIEFCVSWLWVRPYFTKGIPIFRRVIKFAGEQQQIEDGLGEHFSGGWIQPLLFHRFTDHEIGFREQLIYMGPFRYPYVPMMHGLIRFNSSCDACQITGYANWLPLAVAGSFLAPLLAGAASGRPGIVIALGIFSVVVAAMYYAQFSRYLEIVAVLSEESLLQQSRSGQATRGTNRNC